MRSMRPRPLEPVSMVSDQLRPRLPDELKRRLALSAASKLNIALGTPLGSGYDAVVYANPRNDGLCFKFVPYLSSLGPRFGRPGQEAAMFRRLGSQAQAHHLIAMHEPAAIVDKVTSGCAVYSVEVLQLDRMAGVRSMLRSRDN